VPTLAPQLETTERRRHRLDLEVTAHLIMIGELAMGGSRPARGQHQAYVRAAPGERGDGLYGLLGVRLPCR
jgi:hypothetical protein